MKESANIAVGYVKSNAEAFGIKDDFFKKNDIHINAFEGAIKKDGPSAGTALTTAIISSITNKKISNEVAMTGEISLKGIVLPIGGLKEKAIGAYNSKVTKIYIPKEFNRYCKMFNIKVNDFSRKKKSTKPRKKEYIKIQDDELVDKVKKKANIENQCEKELKTCRHMFASLNLQQ